MTNPFEVEQLRVEEEERGEVHEGGRGARRLSNKKKKRGGSRKNNGLKKKGSVET